MNNTCTASVTERQALYVVNSEEASSYTNSQGLSNQKYIHQILDNVDPSNLEAEENILGGLLLDPQAMRRVVNVLEPQHFHLASHKLIYKRIRELYEQKRVSDLLSVKSYLEDKKELEKIGGMAKLTQLLNRTMSAINIDKYAQMVIHKWLQREAIALSNNLAHFAKNYQAEYYADYYQHGNVKASQILDESSLFLSMYEKEILKFTRSKYRGDLTKDVETQTADRIIERIRHIEHTFSNPAHKQIKLMNLAREYKMSEKQLDRMYYKYLLSERNEPIQSLKELREKYGDHLDEWFIQGLIPKGSVTLLHAFGGVGKTRLLYDLIYAMVTGTSWGDQFPVTAPTRRCLIIQTDESRNDMMRSLNSRGFTDDMPIYVKMNWSLENIADLRREIEEKQIDMIVMDSLTSLNQDSLFSENDTDYARRILELKDLAQELNISIIINHHSNSEGKSRGTKAIFNSVSQVLSLKFPSERSKTSCPNRLLVIEKSRFRKPTEYKLAFQMDEETHQWSWHFEGEDTDENEDKTLIDKILKFLKENRNQMFSAEQIAKNCGIALNTARKLLLNLAEFYKLVGRVRSKKKGRPWLHFLAWEIESPPLKENHPKQAEVSIKSDTPKSEEIVLEDNTPEPQETKEKLEDKGQLTDLTDPQTLTDLTDLREGDQLGTSQEEEFPLTDPHFPKNEKISEESKQKNQEVGISEEKVNSKTLIESTIEPNLLTDPLPDPVTDPEKKDQEEGSGRTSNTQSQDMYVKYVGTDIELAKICAVSKNIKILGRIDGQGMCFIWSENWSQPTRVCWGDLEHAERR